HFPEVSLVYYSDWQDIQALSGLITEVIVIALRLSWDPKGMTEKAFTRQGFPRRIEKSAIHSYSISHQPNALRRGGRGHRHWQSASHFDYIGGSFSRRILAGNSFLASVASTLR